MSKPKGDSITVSAMCSVSPGLQYQGVHTASKTPIFRQSLEAGNVEMGNFLALVLSLRLLNRNKIDISALYSNSQDALQWVYNKRCTLFPRNAKKRVKLLAAIREAEAWLEVNSYKTALLWWNEHEWGDVNELVFGKEQEK